MSVNSQLQEIYNHLFDRYGPQHWWPADDPFEVIVGAILTQSTAWTNVEKAIANLKEAGVLNSAALLRLPTNELAELISPSGYYNVKARKLQSFVERLEKSYRGSLDKMFSLDIPHLRNELLSVYGIGEETADSIILYAARKPIFVIDAYTHRIVNRVGIGPCNGRYAELQAIFMENLLHDESLFNEYHALLVRHGKEACRKSPVCPGCCLEDLCRYENL